jgi:lysophospholipase L1-like esterase
MIGLGIVVLLVAELMVRLFLNSPSRQTHDDELGFSYIPNSTVFRTKEGGARIRINRLGLNDGEIGNKENRTRLLVLGDSQTEALQLDQELNFTSVAEKIDPTLDVVNGGRSGLGPLDFVLMQKRLGVVEPSLCVLVLHTGDLSDLDNVGTRLERRENGDITAIRHYVSEKDKIKATFQPFLQRSALATYLLRHYKPLAMTLLNSGADQKEAARPAPDAAALLQDRTEIMRFILDEMDARMPMGLVFFSHLSYQSNRRAFLTQDDAEAREVFQHAAVAAGVPFIDATPELIKVFECTGQPPLGYQNYRSGEGHLNRDGHAAMARALLRTVPLLMERMTARKQ